jgi:hypothetical protein
VAKHDPKQAVLIAGAVSGLVYLFYAFGPVVLGFVLDRWSPPPPPPPQEKGDLSQLIGGLTDALRDVAGLPSKLPAPSAPRPGVPISIEVERTASNEASSSEVLVAVEPPVSSEPSPLPSEPVPSSELAMPSFAEEQKVTPSSVVSLIEAPVAVEPSSEATSDASSVPSNEPVPSVPKEISVAVFEGQAFTLCGYSDFKAEISGGQIVLRSTNRAIPGRTFRGFERRLDAGVPEDLWPDCVVAAGYQTVGGTTRIAISSIGGTND